MGVEIDHYLVLGLPSGEEGARITDIEIGKAYRSKALELHPDKRPNDPNAHAEFQKLKSSYDILKDEKARKLLDDLLRVKRDHRQRQSQFDAAKRCRMMSDLENRKRRRESQFDAKRWRMMSDLKNRERADPTSKAREEEEERISKKLKEEIARIVGYQAKEDSILQKLMKKATY